MVLKVLSDAGKVGGDWDAERLKPFAGANPGQLEDLRRPDRARRQDGLATGLQAGMVGRPLDGKINARRSPVRYHDPFDQGMGGNVQVFPMADGVEEGDGGRTTTAIAGG